MNTDHLILDQGVCRCLHCGREYPIKMPAPVAIFEAIVKTFIKIHKGCEKHETT